MKIKMNKKLKFSFFKNISANFNNVVRIYFSKIGLMLFWSKMNARIKSIIDHQIDAQRVPVCDPVKKFKSCSLPRPSIFFS